MGVYVRFWWGFSPDAQSDTLFMQGTDIALYLIDTVNVDSILLLKYFETTSSGEQYFWHGFGILPHQAECVKSEVNLEWRGHFSYTVSIIKWSLHVNS